MSISINAAVGEGKGKPFRIAELELDEPAADEILVRIVAVGFCHTDLAAREGEIAIETPVVLGHEGVGVVERAGSAISTVVAGDHVVLTYDSCGVCPNCSAGHSAYCYDFSRMNFACRRADGSTGLHAGSDSVFRGFFGQSSFATYAISHERNTVKVSKDLPLERLAPLGCGVQTGAGTVLNALAPKPGSSIAIVGSGTVGLSALLGAVLSQCETIVAVDVLASRLEIARELGATHVVDGSKGGPLNEHLRAIRPAGFTHIVDTTARPELLAAAVLALAPAGELAIVGVPQTDCDLHANMLKVMTQGLSIRGVVEGDGVPADFIPRLAALHMDGRLPFDRFVGTYPFPQINDAVADQAAGRVVKPVLLV
jgi:aryl-alcohol dehydrogenase